MNEYISRQAVNELIENMQNNRFILMCERFDLALLKLKVAEIPAVDVEAELRQLLQSQAEQIRQLKKMLLQACSDFDYLAKYTANNCTFMYPCEDSCPLNSGGDSCKWMYEAEALALIGEDGEQNG